jgi:hypothetical protein
MIGTVRGMRRDEIESSKSPVTQISLVIDSATRSRPETSIVDLDSRARRQKYGTPDNLFNHWNRKQHFLQSSAFSCWVLRFTALSLQVGPLGGAVSLIREVSGGLLREISPSSRRDSSATVWIITIVGLFNSGIRRIRWPRVAAFGKYSLLRLRDLALPAEYQDYPVVLAVVPGSEMVLYA